MGGDGRAGAGVGGSGCGEVRRAGAAGILRFVGGGRWRDSDVGLEAGRRISGEDRGAGAGEGRRDANVPDSVGRGRGTGRDGAGGLGSGGVSAEERTRRSDGAAGRNRAATGRISGYVGCYGRSGGVAIGRDRLANGDRRWRCVQECEAGEQVVVRGNESLQPGQAVEVVDERAGGTEG